MAEQVRTPGVQDGEESDLCSQPVGIGGHLEQGLRAGLEQQVEEWPGRSQRQRVQFVGQGEDDVEVVGVEPLALLGLEPSPACLRLALRATARAAGVIGDGRFLSATDTLVLMSAERCSSATHHRTICLHLLIAQTRVIAFEELLFLGAGVVGHFDGRPGHGRGRW